MLLYLNVDILKYFNMFFIVLLQRSFIDYANLLHLSSSLMSKVWSIQIIYKILSRLKDAIENLKLLVLFVVLVISQFLS